MQALTEKFIACDCTAEGLSGLLRSMSPKAIRDFLDSGYRYHVAVSAGRIVGVVGMRDECHLFHLFVAEEHQGRGIARSLWNAARQSCRAAGNPGVFTVHASSLARPVYVRFGFVPESASITNNGVTAVPMRLGSDPAGDA